MLSRLTLEGEQYGSRAGVWRVLRLFQELKVRCTAYAVGMALELNPLVAKGFEDGGHELASHGYRFVLTPGFWRLKLERANGTQMGRQK